MTARQSQRITVASYWLWTGRRIRISYNSRMDRYGETAAFLKIDVLHPRGASLPGSPAGHVSRVLKGWDKLEADHDYIGYAQQLLGAAPRGAARRAVADPGRQLPLF